MRSSKSRSRSKSNRNRPASGGGNIINRVFDSSGPEGKVRGTPQQIIDKYNQLARDAQLGNDRVATENFQQHAEHYLRLLSEAQREIDQRREEQERQNRERQADRDRERNNNNNNNADGNTDDQRQDHQQQRPERERAERQDDPARAAQPDVLAVSDVSDGENDSGLVETPESAAKPEPKAEAPKKPRKPRAPRKPAAAKASDSSDTPEAAE